MVSTPKSTGITEHRSAFHNTARYDINKSENKYQMNQTITQMRTKAFHWTDLFLDVNLLPY